MVKSEKDNSEPALHRFTCGDFPAHRACPKRQRVNETLYTLGKQLAITPARPRANYDYLSVGCLTCQQHASVSQGQICLDKRTCCHTEIEAADQIFHLTQSQHADTAPTSPSTDPITPGAWQGSHWSANFQVTGMTRPRKNPSASGIRTRDLALWR